MNYMVSHIVGFIVSFIISYYLNCYFVYKVKPTIESFKISYHTDSQYGECKRYYYIYS